VREFKNILATERLSKSEIFYKFCSIHFQVDDQMKLLQNSWSDMLVLDHLHQRLHNQLPDETKLHNGQNFDLLGLGLLGVPTSSDHFNELQNKLQELKFDVGDYICMKFLLLLNPGNNLNEGEFLMRQQTSFIESLFSQKCGALQIARPSLKAMKMFRLHY